MKGECNMCMSFEVISGKKAKGDKGMLEGITKMYRDANYNVAIVPVPVELMEIDTRYQTEVRTERDLKYLTANWNEINYCRLLASLIGRKARYILWTVTAGGLQVRL